MRGRCGLNGSGRGVEERLLGEEEGPVDHADHAHAQTKEHAHGHGGSRCEEEDDQKTR